MQLIQHPFRLRSGTVQTVTDGSDASDVDAVARTALTALGELQLVPSYGVPQAAFDDVSVAAINASLAVHGPQGLSVTAEVTGRTQRSESVTLTIKRESV